MLFRLTNKRHTVYFPQQNQFFDQLLNLKEKIKSELLVILHIQIK